MANCNPYLGSISNDIPVIVFLEMGSYFFFLFLLSSPPPTLHLTSWYLIYITAKFSGHKYWHFDA